MPAEPVPFDEHHIDLVLDYDFEYFLKLDFEENQYSQHQIDEVYTAYHATIDKLKKKLKDNKKQFLLFLDGQVRLMFAGNFLPSHFRFDAFTREASIIDFEATGENWAYFELWKKYKRRERTRKKAWEVIVKFGAVLAYILSFIKLMELLQK